jgi:hypothetical protein
MGRMGHGGKVRFLRRNIAVCASLSVCSVAGRNQGKRNKAVNGEHHRERWHTGDGLMDIENSK